LNDIIIIVIVELFPDRDDFLFIVIALARALFYAKEKRRT